jgi:uncharacterized protein with HEPN domain
MKEETKITLSNGWEVEDAEVISALQLVERLKMLAKCAGFTKEEDVDDALHTCAGFIGEALKNIGFFNGNNN